MISCNTSIQVPAPTIKAVNSTTATDRQKVVFQPLLFKWNGNSWVLTKYGQVLEGTATDAASPSTWFDYNLGYVMGSGQQSFSASGGYYKVAIKYWWLNANGGTSGYDYQWASNYTSQIGAVTSYCSY